MEWFNSIAEKIWRSVDPKTFTILEDILEDMLATVAPAIIVTYNASVLYCQH
jgi:Ca2+-dependent lipid-binding protein